MSAPEPAVARRLIPYGRQSVDEDDVAAVAAVLRSDWLTTGPLVETFEQALGAMVGAPHAVAVSSGTAALHAAMAALGIGPGDEVIVPSLTFAATANAVVYQGGRPVFADVDADTLLVDPASVERLVGPRTRAVVGVDYAGQPCDYDALGAIAARHGLRLAADACHALGATAHGRPCGALAEVTAFSFHPVKHVTTAEGGAATTADPRLADRMRRFRNHGIATDHRMREARRSWYYEMEELGYNYRLNDVQCALGLSQLRKQPAWLERRRAIARRYDAAFDAVPAVRPLARAADVEHAHHLYVIRLATEELQGGRGAVYAALREDGIGVNVHYLPVHLHPFYRDRFGTGPGLCPVAEAAYERLLSLPMFPTMTDDQVDMVVASVAAACERLRR